jgi:hypothetical protein
MKKLLLIILMVSSAFAADQKTEYKYDPNSPEALAAKAKRDVYERDGRELRTPDLYKELVRLDAIRQARTAGLTKPEDVFAEIFKYTDDDARAFAYSSILKKRGEDGDPGASYYHAIHQWDFCLKLQQSNNESLKKGAKECWQGVMRALKRSSDVEVASASFNIGKLYEYGFGVNLSKLVAAEWYVKASEQFNKEKSREDALTALEAALNLVPDHPAALRLRKVMLK